MNIQTAIKLLAESELKQLKVKEDSVAIMGFINMGVAELYKRFNLWLAEATITPVTGTSLYLLDGNDVNVDITLTDHELMKIMTVWLPSGVTSPPEKQIWDVNNEHNWDTVLIPKYNQIKIQSELLTDLVADSYTVRVVYRSAPIFMTVETATIPLPQQFLEALFLYVGWKGHGSIRQSNEQTTDTRSYYKYFEDACKRIDYEGLGRHDDMTSNKFAQRGFV